MLKIWEPTCDGDRRIRNGGNSRPERTDGDMFSKLLILVFGASIIAACGEPIGSGITDGPTATLDDAQGGFGSPSQVPGEFALAPPGRPVSGTLQLDEKGCWYIEFADSVNLVVFPAGFAIPFSEDPAAIDGVDGIRYTSGTAIDGDVHEVAVAALPGGADGKWGNYVAFCDPDDTSIAVFETMQPAFDPAELDVLAVERMIREAVFTKSWPCGRGWAVSTENERVGLFVYQQSTEALSSGAIVSFPDADWLAHVTVGKHLFVNHCDDVMEPWEPLPVIAGEWQISAGALEIIDAFPTGFESGPVGAVLAGARIVTPSGSTLELPTLNLTNRSFNAFAG